MFGIESCGIVIFLSVGLVVFRVFAMGTEAQNQSWKSQVESLVMVKRKSEGEKESLSELAS